MNGKVPQWAAGIALVLLLAVTSFIASQVWAMNTRLAIIEERSSTNAREIGLLRGEFRSLADRR